MYMLIVMVNAYDMYMLSVMVTAYNVYAHCDGQGI